MNSAYGPIKILLVLFGVCLILLGFCMLIGAVNAPIPPLWVSAIFMIAGLSMLGPSQPRLQNIFGIVFLASGTFLAFRAINIITTPWLRYGLGVVLVLGYFKA
jgi:hypothetical protein